MSVVRRMGALFSPIDVRDYIALCSASDEDFPEEFALKMPPPKDQFDKPNCAGQAASLIVEVHSEKQGDYTGRMSADYIYGCRSNGYTGDGRHSRQILKDLMVWGTVPEGQFPKDLDTKEAISAFKAQGVALYPTSSKYRITGFYLAKSSAAVKAALMEGKPIYLAMDWKVYLDENNILRVSDDESAGGHAVVIYGWNKDGWLMQNSWGEDWADGGRAVLAWEVPRRETYIIEDEYSENAKKQKELEYIAKIEQLTADLEAKKNEVELISAQYDASLLKYEESLFAITEQIEKVEALESKVAEVEAEKRDIDAKCDTLTEQIKKLRKDLQEQKEAAGESIEALQNMITLKQSELAFLEADREEHVRVIRELNGELSKQTALKEEMERLQEAHAELQNEYSERVEELNVVQAALEFEKAERAKLENQLIEIKKPYSSGIGKIIAKVLNFILNLFNKEK